MNEETIFSHWNIYNEQGYNMGCPFNIIYNRMSVAIVSILQFEIGDFGFSDKAKNAFLVSSHFSSRTSQRYVFFLTMQRSMMNIISSKVEIFFETRVYSRIFAKRFLYVIPILHNNSSAVKSFINEKPNIFFPKSLIEAPI